MAFAISPPELNVIEEDPDDKKCLECALATGSRVVISGDKDLLGLKQFRNVRILCPVGFLESISEKDLFS